MPAPPPGKLPKDYDRLPVPQPQATSERKRTPRCSRSSIPASASGAGASTAWRCARCRTASPSTTDPHAPDLEVLTVNLDTCIGCMACEKWCPDDYDAIRMVPFATVIKDRAAYETATFSADPARQEDRRLDAPRRTRPRSLPYTPCGTAKPAR